MVHVLGNGFEDSCWLILSDFLAVNSQYFARPHLLTKHCAPRTTLSSIHWKFATVHNKIITDWCKHSRWRPLLQQVGNATKYICRLSVQLVMDLVWVLYVWFLTVKGSTAILYCKTVRKNSAMSGNSPCVSYCEILMRWTCATLQEWLHDDSNLGIWPWTQLDSKFENLNTGNHGLVLVILLLA